jgi:hypothetical protein
MTSSASSDIKVEAHRLIDTLPVDATWDDVMYRVYVRQCIDAGIQDADAGRVVDVDEVWRQFGLTARNLIERLGHAQAGPSDSGPCLRGADT